MQDEPIADPVCIPVYYVSKLARDNGIVVAQVGEGSDELFWGYESWKTYLKLSKLNDKPIPYSAKKIGCSLLNRMGKGNRIYTELLRRGSLKQPVFGVGQRLSMNMIKKG
ncbi:MAG: asparagine synthase-related protein [[Clostridium] symbiosum]